MNVRSTYLFFLALLLTGTLSTGVSAQRSCAADELLEQEIQQDPARLERLQQLERFTQQALESKQLDGSLITIPVIVHVVYKNSTENISDAQIVSQIDVLNDDFRRLNADRNNTPSVFGGVASDTEIEFCLTEVIRKSSRRKRSFGTNNSVKGGRDGSAVVTPESAMNVWVCDIGGGILGYAQFPGGSPSTDGVVCDYRYFGTVGTATAPFDLGRTMTHEVGHYLNLRHIWGDTGCGGDDFVTDTPLAGGPNYTGGSCTFPGPNSCNSGAGDLPDMFQNYMDYSDDGCMNLFTTGQRGRMRAAIQGSRPGLLSAQCDGGGEPPVTPEICNNGIDDDGDGQIDCADGDCASADNCAPTGGGGCDAPTGLSGRSAKGGKDLRFSWNAVSGASSYELQIFVNGGQVYSGTVNGTSITVSGASRGTTYDWQVRANCGANGTSDFSSSSVTARNGARTSVADLAGELRVSPNPTGQSVVRVDWSLKGPAADGTLRAATNEEVEVALISLTGRVVSVQQVEDSGTLQLEVGQLPAGVYLVQVTAADGYRATTKLVKR